MLIATCQVLTTVAASPTSSLNHPLLIAILVPNYTNENSL